jgi:hypothetical protein
MGIYESNYSYGRGIPHSEGQAGPSMMPKSEAKPNAKPEAVTSSRPNETLTQRTMQVLATLPSSFQMHETRKAYPHVMNRIADAWQDPEFFFHVVRNLLLDQRGGRAGFQFSVLAEITNLREYYFTAVRPEMRAKFDREV